MDTRCVANFCTWPMVKVHTDVKRVRLLTCSGRQRHLQRQEGGRERISCCGRAPLSAR